MNVTHPPAHVVRDALARHFRPWAFSEPWPSPEGQAHEQRFAFGEADALRAAFDVHPRGTDWRVLGGVIPGPIPVEWVRVGDTIRDRGVTGTITRAIRSGRMVHLVIGSGHVSFAKVAQQDFITVLSSNHASGGRDA